MRILLHGRKQFVCLILIFVFVFSPCQWISQQSHAFPVIQVLSVVLKAILGKSLSWGLDKAGKYFMGSAWPYVKIVIDPLFHQFPKLLSYDPAESREATRKAIRALDNDQELLNAMERRFHNLERGQKEILDRLRVIEATLEDHEQRIRRLETAMTLPKHQKPNTVSKPATTEFADAFRALLRSARNEFADIKGRKRAHYMYESTIWLPGAVFSWIHIEPPGISRPSRIECRMLDSDLHPNVTRDLVRLTFVDVVEKVVPLLPSSWQIKYDYLWDEIKNPRKLRHGGPNYAMFKADEYPNHRRGRSARINFHSSMKSKKEPGFGIIPAKDTEYLKSLGVDEVFGPGSHRDTDTSLLD